MTPLPLASSWGSSSSAAGAPAVVPATSSVTMNHSRSAAKPMACRQHARGQNMLPLPGAARNKEDQESQHAALPPAVLNHLNRQRRRRLKTLRRQERWWLQRQLAVPVVTVGVRETAEPATEQVGKSVAPAGEEFSAQLSVTVPVYPPLPATVTMDVADAPGAIADGFVADSVKGRWSERRLPSPLRSQWRKRNSCLHYK